MDRGQAAQLGRKLGHRLILVSLAAAVSACGGSSGGTGPSASAAPSANPLPQTLVGRSVETDAVTGNATVSGGEVTITAAGFLTLQTSLALHASGTAYLRPSDTDMSAAAVAPFVFWNGNRSVGWPSGTTRLNYVVEASVAGDEAAVAAIDGIVAQLNAYSFGNINGARVTFARASAVDSSQANCRVRVDPNDVDIVNRGVAGWTRWFLGSGVISTCEIIFRSPEESRQFGLLAHEMIHGVGLAHTNAAISGVTLMNPLVPDPRDRGALDSVHRVVVLNIAMAFRRRPNTLLSGEIEDERGASAQSGSAFVVGIH